MFASMGQERRIKFQLQDKSDDDLLKLKKKKPQLKEVIDEILKERSSQ